MSPSRLRAWRVAAAACLALALFLVTLTRSAARQEDSPVEPEHTTPPRLELSSATDASAGLGAPIARLEIAATDAPAPSARESADVDVPALQPTSWDACREAFLDELLAERVDQRDFRLFDGSPFWEADPKKVYEHISMLEFRLEQMSAEMAVHGLGDSALANWFRECPEHERPTEREGRLMAGHFRSYPVEWTQEQGRWLLERIRNKDWTRYGATQDEAILLHFGTDAIAKALGPQSTALRRLEAMYPQHFSN